MIKLLISLLTLTFVGMAMGDARTIYLQINPTNSKITYENSNKIASSIFVYKDSTVSFSLKPEPKTELKPDQKINLFVRDPNAEKETERNLLKDSVTQSKTGQIPISVSHDFFIVVVKESDNKPLATISVVVAQREFPSGVALAGFAVKGFESASDYKLTPRFGMVDGTLQVVDQRVDRSYNDRFDLNFSAGLQFVFGDHPGCKDLFETVLTLGLYNPMRNRFGLMLSINQPSDGGLSSLRIGPIWYLNRDMDVAITYGAEFYQGNRVLSDRYRFGAIIGADETIDSRLIEKRWYTGFYIGFVYKIGK